MKLPLTGGCACGAIRYEITAEPTLMFKCHCRDCQRLTGGPFVAAIYLPRSAFQLTKGTIRHHFTSSDGGGQHQRGFCAECGSRISGGESADGTSTGIGITAGTLDDPSIFRPQMNFWTSDACAWDPLEKDIPAFEKLPPKAGG
ncbi:MAG: GFA family protein [Chthoniobacter sp.]|nr:GFA family protein [Chthoniobacter sp.]